MNIKEILHQLNMAEKLLAHVTSEGNIHYEDVYAARSRLISIDRKLRDESKKAIEENERLVNRLHEMEARAIDSNHIIDDQMIANRKIVQDNKRLKDLLKAHGVEV